MSKMIQVRNVPDVIHRELKVRAARAGVSLSDLILSELEAMTARPTLDDVLARIAARDPVDLTEDTADAIRAERDARA